MRIHCFLSLVHASNYPRSIVSSFLSQISSNTKWKKQNVSMTAQRTVRVISDRSPTYPGVFPVCVVCTGYITRGSGFRQEHHEGLEGPSGVLRNPLSPSNVTDVHNFSFYHWTLSEFIRGSKFYRKSEFQRNHILTSWFTNKRISLLSN